MKLRFVSCLSSLIFVAGIASAQSNAVYGVTGVAGGSSSLYSINISTGAGTLIGATGFSGVGGLAFSPGGVLYGIAAPVNSEVLVQPARGASPRLVASGRQLITINTTTGAGTLVGGTGVTQGFSDLTFRSDGVLFAITGGGQLYTINTSTGLATAVGSNQGGVTGGGLAFNSSNVLYLADFDALYTVNTTTGVRTFVKDLNFSQFSNPDNTRISGMQFHPANGTLYAAVLTDFFDPFGSVNLSSGLVTNIGNPGVLLEGIAISGTPQAPPPPPPSSVPVPSSILVLTVGLAVTGIWMVWRRKSQRA